MSAVRRYDRSTQPLGKAVRMDNGWLRAPAFVARTGIQEYRDAAGNVTRELRPPEEVFHADTLASGEQVPVTYLHPPMHLDASNAAQYAKGNAKDFLKAPAPNDDKVAATLLVHDGATVEKVDAGVVQVSVGYEVELDRTPGTWRGQHYDAVQRKIRINHVAIVPEGRAGPEVRLRLDSGDAIAVTTPGEVQMKKIKIDGKEYEVEDAIATVIEAASKKVDASKLEAEKARADKAEAELAKRAKDDGKDTEIGRLKAQLEALEEAAGKRDDAAFIDARVDALANARAIVGPQYSGAGKSVHDIKADVVAAVIGAGSQEAKSAVVGRLDSARKDEATWAGYIQARYEDALERHAKSKDHGRELLEAAKSAVGRRHDDAGALKGDPVSEARARAAKAREDAYKREDKKAS